MYRYPWNEQDQHICLRVILWADFAPLNLPCRCWRDKHGDNPAPSWPFHPAVERSILFFCCFSPVCASRFYWSKLYKNRPWMSTNARKHADVPVAGGSSSRFGLVSSRVPP